MSSLLPYFKPLKCQHIRNGKKNEKPAVRHMHNNKYLEREFMKFYKLNSSAFKSFFIPNFLSEFRKKQKWRPVKDASMSIMLIHKNTLIGLNYIVRSHLRLSDMKHCLGNQSANPSSLCDMHLSVWQCLQKILWSNWAFPWWWACHNNVALKSLWLLAKLALNSIHRFCCLLSLHLECYTDCNTQRARNASRWKVTVVLRGTERIEWQWRVVVKAHLILIWCRVDYVNGCTHTCFRENNSERRLAEVVGEVA